MMSETRSAKKRVAKDVNRVIFEHYAGPDAPCVVVFCGIHGNEKAGLRAVERMLPGLGENALIGSLYVLSGNIPALVKNQRFIDRDLNRLWSRNMVSLFKIHGKRISENRDRNELRGIIRDISKQVRGALYFIDIHTTSADSIPFITIDDALINRRFTKVFPVPVVLGIEEYLQGALLSYINQLGFVSLGFEAGEHEDEQSVTNAMCFLYLMLSVAGVLKVPRDELSGYRQQLAAITRGRRYFYEVTYRYAIKEGEQFSMYPGFENFQKVKAGEILAESKGEKIAAEKNRTIFMPLYQQQGEDGFFFVRRVRRWVMGLSATLRILHLDGLLAWLPGIEWIDADKKGLRVDLKTARFMAKSIFHLLGYREVIEDKDHILVYNRERNARKERYPFRYRL